MNVDVLKAIAVSVIFLATTGLYLTISWVFPGRQRGGAR